MGVRSRLHSFTEKSESRGSLKKPVLRGFKIDESIGDLAGVYADSAPPPTAPAPVPAPAPAPAPVAQAHAICTIDADLRKGSPHKHPARACLC